MLKQFSLTQIKEKLSKISSLTYSERELILEELRKFSGGGGISYSELLKVMQDKRRNYKISEVDEKYLRQLLDELK